MWRDQFGRHVQHFLFVSKTLQTSHTTRCRGQTQTIRFPCSITLKANGVCAWCQFPFWLFAIPKMLWFFLSWTLSTHKQTMLVLETTGRSVRTYIWFAVILGHHQVEGNVLKCSHRSSLDFKPFCSLFKTGCTFIVQEAVYNTNGIKVNFSIRKFCEKDQENQCVASTKLWLRFFKDSDILLRALSECGTKALTHSDSAGNRNTQQGLDCPTLFSGNASDSNIQVTQATWFWCHEGDKTSENVGNLEANFKSIERWNLNKYSLHRKRLCRSSANKTRPISICQSRDFFSTADKVRGLESLVCFWQINCA